MTSKRLRRRMGDAPEPIGFSLSPTRNTAAAKRVLGKALNGLKDWEKPTVIDTDKAPTYGAALAGLKKADARTRRCTGKPSISTTSSRLAMAS